jgi:hypothetical protein
MMQLAPLHVATLLITTSVELSNIDFFNCIDYLEKVINLWTYTIYLVMVCCWYLSNHHMLLCNLFIFTVLSHHQIQLLDKMIFIYELIGVNPYPLGDC